MRFTLRQLQVFVAVAQPGQCFRGKLPVAGPVRNRQPAPRSRNWNGESSCLRSTAQSKRLNLNSLGQRLLPQAIALLEQAREIRRPCSTARPAPVHWPSALRLTVGNYLATLLIGSFMQRYPQCQVSLHVQNTANTVQQIAHYELDLGMIEGDCQHPDIEVQPWWMTRLVVFCAPEHPLARRGEASMAELCHEAWILREKGSGTRLTFDQAMRHRPAPLNIRLELEHTEAIKRAVESGLGISCISRLALRDAFRRGSLVAVETPELDLIRQFHFIWHKQMQNAAMSDFLELCRSLTTGVSRGDQIVLPSLR